MTAAALTAAGTALLAYALWTAGRHGTRRLRTLYRYEFWAWTCLFLDAATTSHWVRCWVYAALMALARWQWVHSRDDDDDEDRWKRRREWVRSHLPKPAVIRLRPAPEPA